MSAEQWVLIIGGAVLTLLNGGVAFFLRSIHADFKLLVGKVNDHSERLAVLEFRAAQLDGQPLPRRHTAP